MFFHFFGKECKYNDTQIFVFNMKDAIYIKKKVV
ncbi:hypothetical protein X975_04499, partial [Stegodyphus mimosarum]